MTTSAPQLGPACREAQDGLVSDPVGLERIAQHRRRCPDCQRAAEQIDEVRSAVLAGGGLDEVARRRIRQRLAAQVDGLATLNAQRTRRQWLWVAAAAVLLLALGVVVVADRLALDRPTPAPDLPTAKQGSRPPAPQQTARLRREGQTRTVSILDLTAGAVRADVLVPSGVRRAKERRPMTRRASITLQGPGRLRVVESGPRLEGTTLRLERGLLLARVQPSARAAAFRVLARGYCVEVKGTVFAVDARGDQLRVVVTRGAVAVRSEGAALHAGVMVRAGQGWQPAGGIKPATAALVTLLDPAASRVVLQPDPTRRGSPSLTDVERLYRRAEASMRGGRTAEAARLLAELTRRHPRHALATAALYELADRSYRAGDPLRARAYLKRLLAQRGGDRSLHDPAHHLICRIEVEARRVDQAIACLRAFRAAHPRSPHAAESLHTLAGLLHGKSGCRAARGLWRRYLADYPRGAHTARIRARLAACR